MRIFQAADAPAVPTDSSGFTGVVWSKRLAVDEGALPVHVYRVEFEPSARTRWHTHSGPQWLFVTEGAVRVQSWGSEPRDVHAGDAVMIARGEKHWHGAAPGAKGVHLAVNIDASPEWLEPVSDEQYLALKA